MLAPFSVSGLHVLFYIISLSFVSHFPVFLVLYLMRMGGDLLVFLLTYAGRCYVCTNYAFEGLLWKKRP